MKKEEKEPVNNIAVAMKKGMKKYGDGTPQHENAESKTKETTEHSSGEEPMDEKPSKKK